LIVVPPAKASVPLIAARSAQRAAKWADSADLPLEVAVRGWHSGLKYMEWGSRSSAGWRRSHPHPASRRPSSPLPAGEGPLPVREAVRLQVDGLFPLPAVAQLRP